MPTLTQIEYILAVEKLRHFGKASKACHISQPTLSMQIQKVEEEVGFMLFDRLQKPVLPTEKGQRFIEQAKVLIREHQKLIEMSRLDETEISGEFRLGIIPTLTPYVIPLFIEEFSKRYPKVQLTIDELKTDSIVDSLREDKLDAGILATPLHEEGLKEKPLFHEPFLLYLSPSHPLLKKKKISQDDLDGSEMWLLQDGHCFRNQMLQLCSINKKQGVFKNIQFEGGNLETLKQLVKNSQGYTFIPWLLGATLSKIEIQNHVREFEKPVPTREISLIYRRNQWKLDILQALEKTLLEKIPMELRKTQNQPHTIVKLTKKAS